MQSDHPIETIQLVVLVCVILAIETHYWTCILKDEIPFSGDDAPLISVEEFHARVKQGEKLVILDEFVLDVSLYADEHPGGTFSITANIGRDVSKYFHGGYSLETLDLLPHYTHGTNSRQIVNKLIVAKLQNV